MARTRQRANTRYILARRVITRRVPGFCGIVSAYNVRQTQQANQPYLFLVSAWKPPVESVRQLIIPNHAQADKLLQTFQHGKAGE
jgi:hypothetical protein